MKNNTTVSIRIPDTLYSKIDKLSNTPDIDQLIDYLDAEMKHAWGVQTDRRGATPSFKTTILRYCMHAGWNTIESLYETQLKDIHFDEIERTEKSKETLIKAQGAFFLNELKRESPKVQAIITESLTPTQSPIDSSKEPLSLPEIRRLILLDSEYSLNLNSLKPLLNLHGRLTLLEIISELEKHDEFNKESITIEQN